jgi:hypothetical protein
MALPVQVFGYSKYCDRVTSKLSCSEQLRNPCGGVLLDKLIVAHIFKRFLACYGTYSFQSF